jgi:hypothetical protein
MYDGSDEILLKLRLMSVRINEAFSTEGGKVSIFSPVCPVMQLLMRSSIISPTVIGFSSSTAAGDEYK